MRVFTVQVSGPARQAPLLILHGYPTSSFDFAAVIDRLAGERTVVVFDFPGFGLWDKRP